MRTRLLLTLMLACAGCGPSTPPAPTPPVSEGVAAEGAVADSLMTMTNIDLVVHDSRATAGQNQRPMLLVHAETVTVREGKVYEFDKGHAIIYGATEKDDMTLDGQVGRFVEDQSAQLGGGVQARMGAMTIFLEDIVWQRLDPASEGAVDAEGVLEEGEAASSLPLSAPSKAPSVAYSDRAVRVESPTLNLAAAAMRIYPAEKRFILTDCSGSVALAAETPPPTEGAPAETTTTP